MTAVSLRDVDFFNYKEISNFDMEIPSADDLAVFYQTALIVHRDKKAKKLTSGILYTWTGLGKMVHTGTYQYVPVQHGIRQYKNFTVVRTGMYQYIPVRTFNKTSCFLTHPERVRRDNLKIKVVQLLCMGYNVTKSNIKTAQV